MILWFYDSKHVNYLAEELLGVVTNEAADRLCIHTGFDVLITLQWLPKYGNEKICTLFLPQRMMSYLIYNWYIKEQEYSLRVEYFLVNTQDIHNWHFKLWLTRLKMTWKGHLIHSLPKDRINNTFIILYWSLPNL